MKVKVPNFVGIQHVLKIEQQYSSEMRNYLFLYQRLVIATSYLPMCYKYLRFQLTSEIDAIFTTDNKSYLVLIK